MPITKNNFIKKLGKDTDDVLEGFRILTEFIYKLAEKGSEDVSGKAKFAAMKASNQNYVPFQEIQFKGQRLIETLKLNNVKYEKWLEIYQEGGIENYLNRELFKV